MKKQMRNTRLLEEFSPRELENLKDNSGIVYLPLGVLEWHQQHLPFGVDAYISYELCKRASVETGGCIIPPLYFGTDREHEVDGEIFHGMDAQAKRILPGNFYFLKESFFKELLEKIINNIEEQGLSKLVIVSAHSGIAQQRVLEAVKAENKRNLKIIIIPGKKFRGGIDHAGVLETSYMMAIRPDLVDIFRLGNPPYEACTGSDQKKATAEQGEKMIKTTVEQIVSMVLD
jgi:creatinine amidohydrolase